MQGDVWKNDPEWFRKWFNHPAYHILYGPRSEAEANALVNALSGTPEWGGTGKVLDAGCGAGRHARALAKHAQHVVAFDLSPESIAMAQATEGPHVEYHVEDLRDVVSRQAWHGQFDLVTNFFTSLGYFEAEKDQIHVLRGLVKCVKPTGRLLLDYLNVDQVEADLVPSETVIRKGVQFHIRRRIQGGWIEKSIQFAWEGRDVHFVERVQALRKSTLTQLLAHHGMVVTRAWGSYDLNPWTPRAPRCMLLATFANA